MGKNDYPQKYVSIEIIHKRLEVFLPRSLNFEAKTHVAKSSAVMRFLIIFMQRKNHCFRVFSAIFVRALCLRKSR